MGPASAANANRVAEGRDCEIPVALLTQRIVGSIPERACFVLTRPRCLWRPLMLGQAVSLREHGDVGGVCLGLGQTGVGDARKDAAPIVVADVPAAKAVVLEALDQAGKGALRLR